MTWYLPVMLGTIGSMFGFLATSYLVNANQNEDQSFEDKNDIGSYVFKWVLLIIGLAHAPLLFILANEITLIEIGVDSNIYGLTNFAIYVSSAVFLVWLYLSLTTVVETVKEGLASIEERH